MSPAKDFSEKNLRGYKLGAFVNSKSLIINSIVVKDYRGIILNTYFKVETSRSVKRETKKIVKIRTGYNWLNRSL